MSEVESVQKIASALCWHDFPLVSGKYLIRFFHIKIWIYCGITYTTNTHVTLEQILETSLATAF
jgi:hypothetical protein